MNDTLPKLKHRNLPLLLLQAREQVVAQFRPIFNAHEVTDQQWRILRELLTHPSLEPRELGEMCRISSPSLAGVLSRMEELDLIRRERLPHDHRRVSVQLTDRSRALAARMAPLIDATYERIKLIVGNEFCEHCFEVLDRLIASLQQSGAARSVGSAPV